MYTVHYYYIHDVSQRSTEKYATKQEMHDGIDEQAKHGYKASHVEAG